MKGGEMNKGADYLRIFTNPKKRGLNKEFGFKFLSSLQCGWTQISSKSRGEDKKLTKN
jgi:hypothetical protein